MPDTYHAARDRIAARRAANPPRTWWDTAKDYGGALKESGIGMVEGLDDMIKTATGDPMTAVRHGQDLYDSYNRFKEGSAGDRTKQIGVGAVEQVTGLPISQVYDEVKKGDYAKAAGHATIPLALLGLGTHSALKGRVPTEPPPPGPPRIAGLLPERTGPRFVGGDAGVADVTSQYRRHLGNPNPLMESGTPTLADIGDVVDVGPTLAAQGFGPHPLPPTSVGSQMTAAAAEARRGMLGERAQLPKKAVRITKKEQARLQAGGDPGTVQMPGFDNRTLFKKKGEYPLAAPTSAGIFPASNPESRAFEALVPERYKSAAADVAEIQSSPALQDVMPVDLSETERLKNATARPSNGGEAPAKFPRPGKTKLQENFPGNKAVAATLEENKAQSMTGRPYGKLQAADLKTLADRGDAQALKEISLREKVANRGRLANQRGSVDFSVGIEKAKGQLKKIPGILADAQRAALLTGAAVPKSALGAVGGLATELGERALTQSPAKTAGDVGKVIKSIPGGLKKMGKAAIGQEDVVESGRHLAKPGILSRPAIRVMAALDAPFRHALESIGLQPHEALQRILNASPSSQTGKDLITFLSKHPAIKNVIAPVGAVTSTNQIEQGLLRTPGVNMLKNVRKMDPKAGLGKQLVRGAAGAGAAYGGEKLGEEMGDDHYILKGLLTSLAGPYSLPMGLGMAFSSKDELSKAIDNIGNAVGREAPIRIPSGNLSTEVERRFTPAIYRQLTEEKTPAHRPQRSRRARRQR